MPADAPALRPPAPGLATVAPPTAAASLVGPAVTEDGTVAEVRPVVVLAVVLAVIETEADEAVEDVAVEEVTPADQVDGFAWGLLSYWKTTVLPKREGSK